MKTQTKFTKTLLILLSLLFAWTLALGIFVSAQADESTVSGSGTEDDPYVVSTAEQFAVAFAEWTANGGTLKLLADIALADGIDIPATFVGTLDLNGHTISYNSAETVGNALITNKGNLTIDDSSQDKTGKIIYESSAPSTNFAYSTNTITNCGVLTINGGTIQNNTNGGSSNAIDNNNTTANVVLTINDGNISAYKITIRQFANSATYTNAVIIKGGSITSTTRAVQIHLAGSSNNVEAHASLSVSGGTITSTSQTQPLAVYCWSGGNAYSGVEITVTDGTFNGDIAVGGGAGSNGSGAEKVTISGGTFVGTSAVYTYNSNTQHEIAISGGSFETAPDDEYLDASKNYICATYNQETGMYTPSTEHTYGELVAKVDATCSATGFESHYLCNGCGTCFTTEKAETTYEALTIAINPNLHVYDNDCDAECNLCGTTRTPADHVYGDLVVKVDATCSATGLEAHYFCDVCDTYFTTEKVETTIADLTIAIDENAHAWGEWTQTTAPTCTAKGVETRVCSHNSAHTETRDVEKIAHTSQDIPAVAPTCTQTGLTAGAECSVCGEILTDQQTVDALGHDFAGGEYLHDETHHWQECSRCDVTNEKAIHEYVADVCVCGKEATNLAWAIWSLAGVGIAELALILAKLLKRR